MTHMLPLFHLNLGGRGDSSLLDELWRTRPALHVFGHFHASHSIDFLHFDRFEATYESSRRQRGSFIALVRMLFHLAAAPFAQRPIGETWLVNAATLGGHRDELLQDLIVVEL